MARTEKPFDLEMLFRALADRTRLRLLHLLGDDEVCVCFLVEILGVNQPKVSRHLAYLRRAGVVAARKQGLWVHYRIAPPADAEVAGLLASVRECIAKDPEMRSDRSRLVDVCCAPELPEHLAGAPRPASIVSCGCS